MNQYSTALMEEKSRNLGNMPQAAPSTGSLLPTVNPSSEKAYRAGSSKPSVPAAIYVIAWISLSSSVILFNKWILNTLEFPYPVLLTTYHLTFATIMTQLLARYTNLLDGRKTVKMTSEVYVRTIMPIGLFFSLSLICGNLTYLYLSVSFIQMLKATSPVAVLICSWAIGIAKPNFREFLNVSIIVFGVVMASVGELQFEPTGFFFQVGGIIFEALRLTMVQRLLSSAEYRMDPLVSLYYFAPICALMNGTVALYLELPHITLDEVYGVGLFTLFLNGLCAFLLNVSVVFLIGKTSVLVLTLCGVLKDILLVVASMVIWGDPVTRLQFFGYGIALSGMIYYKLGLDTLKSYASLVNRRWAEFGANRPATRKLVVIAGSLLLLFALLGVFGPANTSGYINPAYVHKSAKYTSGRRGGGTKGT